MSHLTLLGLLLLLVGCGDAPVTEAPEHPVAPAPVDPIAEPSPSEPDPAEPTPCTVAVSSSTPADGATDAYVRAPVRVVLSEPDPTAVVTVADADGIAVPGTSTVDGDTVTWTGDPLAPLSAWTVEVAHACGAEAFGFETSEVGLPLEVGIEGRTYALDVSGGLWTAPEGVGAVFAAVFEPYRLLVGVTDTSGSETLDLITALSEDGLQYPCAPSVDLPDARWADPYFETTLPRLALDTGAFALVVDDFSLDGTVAPDGSRIEGAVLSGFVDTRALGGPFGLGDGPYAICQVAATLGAYCTACLDGALVCLDVRVEGISAPLVPQRVEVLTEQDVATNLACDGSE